VGGVVGAKIKQNEDSVSAHQYATRTGSVITCAKKKQNEDHVQ
jgi:hypothetical protein